MINISGPGGDDSTSLNDFSRTSVAPSTTDAYRVFTKIPAKSPENVFCRVTQNLYNSIGTVPISEHAKNPFNILRTEDLMFALPF